MRGLPKRDMWRVGLPKKTNSYEDVAKTFLAKQSFFSNPLKRGTFDIGMDFVSDFSESNPYIIIDVV